MVKKGFGQLELAILHALKSGKRLTVRQVHSLLGEDNKYTTVMTVMNRLVEKKQLGREKMGLQYEYWIMSTQLPPVFQQIKNKVFGVKTAEMISYLIDSSEELSDNELEEIEKLIQAAKGKKR